MQERKYFVEGTSISGETPEDAINNFNEFFGGTCVNLKILEARKVPLPDPQDLSMDLSKYLVESIDESYRSDDSTGFTGSFVVINYHMKNILSYILENYTTDIWGITDEQ